MSTGDPDADAVIASMGQANEQKKSSITGDPDADAVIAHLSKPDAKPSWLQSNITRPLGLTGRAIIQGVAGLPLMAMDAGVAARNAVTGSKYDYPSSMFNQALTQIGLPEPHGLLEKIGTGIESAAVGSRLPMPKAADQAPPGFNPNASSLTQAQQAAMQGGENLGMRTTPGQASGSRSLQQIEAKLEGQPWTSGPANAIKSTNMDVLNRAWAKAIGEDTNTIDSTVLARANDRLGEVFNSVRDQTPRTIDPKEFTTRLQGINADFEGLLPNGAGITDNALVKRLVSYAEDGSATGEQLGSLTSKLGRAAAKQMSGPSGDRDLGMALFRVKDYVDDLVSQGLSPEDNAAYTQARQQYRSLMQLTSRVGNLNPNTGNVSAASLANYLQKSDKRGFLYGGNQSDAYNATRFAQAFKPIVGDSGTATRKMELGDLMKLPYGVPLNLLSRAYYKGWLTPSAPGAETIGRSTMGAIPLWQLMGQKPQEGAQQ